MSVAHRVKPLRLAVLAAVVTAGLHLMGVAPLVSVLSDPVSKGGTPFVSVPPGGARVGEPRLEARGVRLGGPALSPRVDGGSAPMAVRAAAVAEAPAPPPSLPAGVSRARGPPPPV